jgi:hypothetical protein
MGGLLMQLLALGLDAMPTHVWWKKDTEVKKKAIELIQQVRWRKANDNISSGC